MSCWREQTVLRLPAKAIGIHTMEEWYRFEREYEDRMDWEEGCFAPSLCTYEHGPFLDYILKDRAPVQGNGCDYDARPLTPAERRKYLPVFQRMVPGFTREQMEDVHYCECIWYDGTEAPYCY